MKMRTPEEIVTYPHEDWLGFGRNALLSFLTFEQAKPWLKEGADPMSADGTQHWDEATQPLTEASVMDTIREYMPFAWEKVEDHRGISAARSVLKMQAWVWLLGREDLVETCSDASLFDPYGAPILAALCKAFDLPIPVSDILTPMIAGKPCGPECWGCNAEEADTPPDWRMDADPIMEDSE